MAYRYYTLYEHKLIDEYQWKDLPKQNSNLCQLKRLVAGVSPRAQDSIPGLFMFLERKRFLKEDFSFQLTVYSNNSPYPFIRLSWNVYTHVNRQRP